MFSAEDLFVELLAPLFTVVSYKTYSL